MTNEEAIECLSERVSIGGTGEQNCMVVFGVNTDTLDEAFDMAISAIRQQETVTNRNEPLTNAQKIRSMSDEELANLLCCTGWRMIEQKECLEWLQQPAEEDDHA